MYRAQGWRGAKSAMLTYGSSSIQQPRGIDGSHMLTSALIVVQVPMASAAGKAIQAVKQFTTTGNASRVSVTKEITIGLTLGIAAGLTWKVRVQLLCSMCTDRPCTASFVNLRTRHLPGMFLTKPFGFAVVALEREA